MVNKSGNVVKKLFSVIAVLIAVLALALPAQASEYLPPPQNLAQTPTIQNQPGCKSSRSLKRGFSCTSQSV